MTLRPAVGRLAALVALAAATGLARAAAAPAPLPVTLAADHGHLLASLDLSAAFPPSVERDLGNGLTNVVAVWIAVAPASGGPPTLEYTRVVDILFDVWEETYAVTVKDPKTPQGTRMTIPSFAALRKLLADERGLDLGSVAALPQDGFVIEASVLVNAVSKEQLQRTREYIANPAGGTHSGGGSRSMIGAIASFLLREPNPGSNVHLFRSRPYRAGEVVSR